MNSLAQIHEGRSIVRVRLSGSVKGEEFAGLECMRAHAKGVGNFAARERAERRPVVIFGQREKEVAWSGDLEFHLRQR